MLEELCRALASSPSTELTLFFEQLLGGPLTALLQNYHEQGPLASQACDVLSTMQSQTMADLKVRGTNRRVFVIMPAMLFVFAVQFPIRMLALSLPLELSGDETAPNSVNVCNAL